MVADGYWEEDTRGGEYRKTTTKEHLKQEKFMEFRGGEGQDTMPIYHLI